MTNKEQFLKLVSDEASTTAQKIKARIDKREQLRESKAIAFKVIDKLKEIKWSQKKLATQMDVTPQYINKMLRGKENLTLSTQIKLQKLLDIPILASYFEKAPEVIIVETNIIELTQSTNKKQKNNYINGRDVEAILYSGILSYSEKVSYTSKTLA